MHLLCKVSYSNSLTPICVLNLLLSDIEEEGHRLGLDLKDAEGAFKVFCHPTRPSLINRIRLYLGGLWLSLLTCRIEYAVRILG